jgi:hypothetical protein
VFPFEKYEVPNSFPRVPLKAKRCTWLRSGRGRAEILRNERPALPNPSSAEHTKPRQAKQQFTGNVAGGICNASELEWCKNKSLNYIRKTTRILFSLK